MFLLTTILVLVSIIPCIGAITDTNKSNNVMNVGIDDAERMYEPEGTYTKAFGAMTFGYYVGIVFIFVLLILLVQGIILFYVLQTFIKKINRSYRILLSSFFILSGWISELLLILLSGQGLVPFWLPNNKVNIDTLSIGRSVIGLLHHYIIPTLFQIFIFLKYKENEK